MKRTEMKGTEFLEGWDKEDEMKKIAMKGTEFLEGGAK